MRSDRDHGATFIREVRVQYRGARLRCEDRLLGPEDVARIAHKIVRGDAREHFLAIYLDSRHRPIAYQVVSFGTADQSLVPPREIFQPAVLVGATAVIVMHYVSGHIMGVMWPRAICGRSLRLAGNPRSRPATGRSQGT